MSSEILHKFRNRWPLPGSSVVLPIVMETFGPANLPERLDEPDYHGPRLLCYN